MFIYLFIYFNSHTLVECEKMVAGEGFEPNNLESMRLPCEPLHQPAATKGKYHQMATAICLTNYIKMVGVTGFEPA